jgi:predicted ATPase/DNA-binding CsgD family transcriptional regulator
VLDNCEHVAQACHRVVDRLVQGCPGVSVLATSREPLDVQGEVTWRVASMSLPTNDEPISIDDISRFDALRLFWERARRARPQLAVTDALAEASARICRRVDGIPLAIELAAARCRQFSPERIARELEDHYRLIGGGQHQLARQRTLEASVEWSHRLLDDDEQVVFRRLGVFAGWFPLDAAEAVVSSFGDLDEWSVLEHVGRLVDKSLLTIADEGAAAIGTEPLYRMLETVRFHALDRARTAGELETLRDTHATWWTNWTANLDIDFIPSIEHMETIGTRYPNLRAALEWLQPAPERAATLVQHLSVWAIYAGLVNDVTRFVIPIARALHRSDDPAWIDTVSRVALPALLAGDLEFVTGPAAEALDLAEQRGDHANAAYCLLALALLDPTAERWRELVEHGARANRDDFAYLGRLTHAGRMTRDVRADWEELEHLIELGTTRYQQFLPYTLMEYTSSLLILGDYEAAHRCFTEAINLAHDALRLGWTLASGAAIGLARSDPSDAATILEQLRSNILRGVPSFMASMWRPTIAIAVHHLMGEPLDVDELVAMASEPVYGVPWRAGLDVMTRELLDRAIVEPAQAIHDQCAASPLADTPVQRLYTGALAARIAQTLDDPPAAEHHWRELLTLAVEQGARPFAIDALEGIAAAIAETAALHAARLLGAAHAARETIEYRFRFPNEQLRHDQALALVVEALGDDELTVSLEAGRVMTLADAAAYAQRTHGDRRRPAHGWASLTPTEHDVARLVAEGATNPAIARKLIMSVNTVKTHIAHVYTKLDINSRAQLATIVSHHTEP